MWIKISNCWFSEQSLSSSEDDDISLKSEISWTLAFPGNLFKLQLIKSAEQLQYVILMLISQFWQVLVNFHLFRLRKGKWNCWLTWKMTDKEVLRLHLTQTMFSTMLVSSLDFLRWKKNALWVVELWGTPPLPPWSYPVVIVRSKEVNLSHICVNKNM